MGKKLREFFDRFFLTDHEWKKKYCPPLHHYLFEMTDEELRNIRLDRSTAASSSDILICDEVEKEVMG